MNAIRKYQTEMFAHVDASGKMPAVSVLGAHDYDELMGELVTFFGLEVTERIHSRPFEYRGISIYKNFSNARGFWFGGMPV